MIIETERLVLRPWEEADASALYKYACDPDVGPAAGWAVHRDAADSLNIIRTVLSAEGTYAVTIKERGDEPVGSIGIFKTDAIKNSQDQELGYWIGQPFWGNGYIPEAARRLMALYFEDEQHKRMWCAHFAGNTKSRRVIEKCGFHGEFIRETTAAPLNERLITYFYSVRRTEWLSKNACL